MKKTVTLAIAAAVQAANGNMTRASQLLMAAGAQPDLRNVVSNLQTLPARAGTRATASTTPRRRVQAGAWPFRVSASTDTDLTTPDNYGTDLREEVDLNGTMREVQQGGLEDDLELMGLGDDIGGDDDFAVAGIEDDGDDFAEDGFDEFAAADDDEDEGYDEEDDADKGDDKKEESRRLTAALLNLKELAAKKKAKKKPARK